MAELEKKTKKTKIEQIIIERFVKLSSFDEWTDVDNSELRIWKAKKWKDINNCYKEYELDKLLSSGYRIVSITKAFTTANGGRYGLETAILEKEVEA